MLRDRPLQEAMRMPHRLEMEAKVQPQMDASSEPPEKAGRRMDDHRQRRATVPACRTSAACDAIRRPRLVR
jgi:hypothetical protein